MSIYDRASKPAAAALRQSVSESFDVKVGSWHDEPVGAHPRWSYQLAFEPGLFGEIIPWLALKPERPDHLHSPRNRR